MRTIGRKVARGMAGSWISLTLLLAACGGGGGGDGSADAPPVITAQPQAATVPLGMVGMFSVAATGSKLSYQWRRNGADIAGATQASYTTPAVTTADAGAAYSVVVSNAAGTVDSRAASLTAAVDSSAQRIAVLELLRMVEEDLPLSELEVSSDDRVLHDATTACPGGGSFAYTLDGSARSAGAVLSPANATTIAGVERVSASDCIDADKFRFSGAVSTASDFRFAAAPVSNFFQNSSGTAVNRFEHWRRAAQAGASFRPTDITFDGGWRFSSQGTLVGTEHTNRTVYSMDADFQLRNEANALALNGLGLGQEVFTLTTDATTPSQPRFRSAVHAISGLGFSVNGTKYLADGLWRYDFSYDNAGTLTTVGAGSIQLRSGALSVGQLVMTGNSLFLDPQWPGVAPIAIGGVGMPSKTLRTRWAR